jgi:signal transduction histidine kinase
MGVGSDEHSGGHRGSGARVQRFVILLSTALTAASTLFTGAVWFQNGDPWQLATTGSTAASTLAFVVALVVLARGRHELSAKLATAGGVISVTMSMVTNPSDTALLILVSSLAILLLVPPTLFAGQKLTRGWLGVIIATFYVGVGARVALRGNDMVETQDALFVALISPPICLLIQWLLTKRLVVQLEDALAESEGLRADLEQQNSELAESRELAEKASHAKSVFLANMSHELRTPLNAVIGYSEMLAEDAEDSGQDQILADVRKIEGAGQQLLAMIDDVLDMARIEAGHTTAHAERFEVSELVADLEQLAGPLVARHGNTFAVEVDEGVGELHTDRAKLRQVMSNLISNAAKFTEGGEITLRVRPTRLDGEEAAAFALEDTGVGMDEVTQVRVFEPFVQADESDTRTHGGTGLGLNLVTRLTGMLRGTVEVESEVGVGSTFTVVVPLALERGAGDEAPRTS